MGAGTAVDGARGGVLLLELREEPSNSSGDSLTLARAQMQRRRTKRLDRQREARREHRCSGRPSHKFECIPSRDPKVLHLLGVPGIVDGRCSRSREQHVEVVLDLTVS